MAQYIYTMHNVRKAVGDKVILDNVTLSFLPGAKIGVVGPNGAGKSTVLKIMAGLDTASNGDAVLTPGYSVGILLQEPPLDETRTCSATSWRRSGHQGPARALRRGQRQDGRRVHRRARSRARRAP